MKTFTALLCLTAGIFIGAAITSAHPGERRRCIKDCPMTFDPVCDNEGTTHPNQCSMEVVACRRRVDLKISHLGMCQNTDHAAGTRSPQPTFLGRIIHLFSGQEKESNTRCSTVCPLTYTPVCGSNSLTFPNECAMRNHACWHHIRLTVLHEGPCTSWD